MTSEEARERFSAARVARLATVDAAGRPHLVPVCFAVSDDIIYTAVDDAKPKASARLRRLANLAANPSVTLLADHYSDDWDELWWARADGTASIHEPGHSGALAALAERYPQYAAAPPPGPVIAVEVLRWSGWSAR